MVLGYISGSVTKDLFLVPFLALLTFWFTVRLILSLLTYYLDHKYNIKLKFASVRFIGVNGISLHLPNGFTIEADSTWLSAHLFTSRNQSRLCLNITDFRIKGHLIEFDLHSRRSTSSASNSLALCQDVFANDKTSKTKDFILFFIKIVKYISLRISNFSFNQLTVSNINQAECLLNSTMQEFYIFYPNKGPSSMVSFDGRGVCAKLLQHGTDQTCLANISLDVRLFVAFIDGALDLLVSLDHLDANLNEGLFTMFLHRKIYQNGGLDQPPKVTQKSSFSIFKDFDFHNIDFRSNILKLQITRDRSQRVLTIENDKSCLKITKKYAQGFSTATELHELKVSSNQTLLASLTKLSFEMTIMEERSIKRSLKINHRSELLSLHVSYASDEVNYWCNLFNSPTSGIKSAPKSDNYNINNFVNSIISSQDPLLKIALEIEFRDIHVEFSPSNFHKSITCSLQTGKCTSILDTDPIKQEISFELLLDSLNSFHKEQNAILNESSISPICGKILFWRSCRFKLSHTTFSKSSIFCSMEDSVLDIDNTENILNHMFPEQVSSNVQPIADSKSSSVFNVYALEMNLNSLSATSSDLKLTIESLAVKYENSRTIVNFKNSYILPLSPIPNCEKHLFLTTFEMSFDKQNHERSFIFTDENFLLWSVYSHLNVIQSIRKIKTIWRHCKRSKKSEDKKRHQWTTIIKLGNNVNIGALVSNKGQKIFLQFNQMSLEIPSSEKLSFKTDGLVSVNMDGNVIGKFEKIRIKKYPEAEGTLLINRRELSTCGVGISTPRNKVYYVSIESIKLVFPYRYNFADTFNEKFIPIIKWLKKYHRSSEDQLESVKSDVVLRVASFAMEVGDDPFEVKLRDNYELMEDEYHESKKRIQMWREKIDESKKKNMSLTDAKLNELYAALSKKQENVYIERHRKMYTISPPRTHLFIINMENFEMKIAADGNLTGYDKLVDLMKTRLDKHSIAPPDLKFVTLWGRYIQGSVGTFCSRLRDFPKPLFEFKSLMVNGLLVGAEKEAASRSRRDCFIDMGPNKESFRIERSMNPLKLYHDLHFDVESIAYTHGACWEPVLQQLSLCFEFIIKPSIDPSPTLPWWDRVRLLLHGIMRVSSSNLSFFFHASLNPYNSTELIEFAFNNSIVEWLTGRIGVIGDVGFLVHTASKYDDRRILHFPNAKITIDMLWECLGHPFDHHSVAPHAADKVPEYSIHQNWDSYRAFRSQNLKVHLNIENMKLDQNRMPTILLFSSTLKWLENQKAVFRGIARLTRRGKLFGNTNPRKKPFTRIFKEIRVTICLRKFKIYYWSSLSKQLGFECFGESLKHCAHHNIFYVPYGDGLHRRPRPVSQVACMNTEVSDVEVWLTRNENEKVTPNLEEIEEAVPSGIVKKYFFSFKTMSYNRASSETTSPTEIRDSYNDPTHQLVVRDLKGAWTKQNRDVAVSLFDLYMNAEQLKRNLSTDALKAVKIDGQTCYIGGSPIKGKHFTQTHTVNQVVTATSSTSPASTLNKSFTASMLQRLVADSESNPDGIITDECESVIANDEPKLRGISACSGDNVIRKNWLIELVNSQVMLRGCETSGYVIVSAAKTQIVQKLFIPVWKDRTLLSKTALIGSIECMQYYATVDAQSNDDDEISWLTLEKIEELSSDLRETSAFPGSEQERSSDLLSHIICLNDEESDLEQSHDQLQRIISRCSCQFYYANYSNDVPPEIVDKAPPPPEDSEVNCEPWEKEIAVDSFTMNHHDLEIFTNSQQFAMIMDLVNNLLLYVEPHKQEAFENLQRMKFKSVLDPTESFRGPILTCQDNLRAMITRLKQLEKESYFVQKAFLDEKQSIGNENETLKEELTTLERQIKTLKEKITRSNEELTLMINLFKESQLTADKSKERQSASQEGGSSAPEKMMDVVRRIEICFKQACWKLTETNGKTGLAKVELNNFIYTKVVKSDDSFEHSLELGFIKVSNLMPNQKYPIVLEPAPSKPNIPVDSRRALRIYCRESPPQNGIPIKEHFEVNVNPLNVMITSNFSAKMKSFFFDRDDRNLSVKDFTLPSSTLSSSSGTGRRRMRQQKSNSVTSSSTGSVASSSKGIGVGNVDDVEKMRQRAQRSKTFAYIKITEVPLRVTYRGTKDKNVANIQDLKCILPTIEYHNQTWEWLDLINAIKIETKRRLVSQAVKQKLGIGAMFTASIANNFIEPESEKEESEIPQKEAERKAKLLLGETVAANKTMSLEKTIRGLSHLIQRKPQ